MSSIVIQSELPILLILFVVVKEMANNLDDLHLGLAGVLSSVLIVLMLPTLLAISGQLAGKIKLFRLSEELLRTVCGFYRIAAFIPIKYTASLYYASLDHLFHSLKDQQRYDAAIETVNETLQFSKKRFGEQSIEVIGTLINQAGLYHVIGSNEQAESSAEQAMRALEAGAIADKQQTEFLCLALNNLAIIIADTDHPEKAGEVIAQAIALKEKRYPKNDPAMESFYSNQGYISLKCGDFQAAEQCLRTAIKIIEGNGVKNKLYYAAALNNLGDALLGKNDVAEAEKYLLQSYQLRQQFLRPDHPHMGYSFNNLGKLYREQGKFTEAEENFQKALKIREAISPVHPDVAVTLSDYAELLDKMGRSEDAEELRKRASNIRNKKSQSSDNSSNANQVGRPKSSHSIVSTIIIRSAIVCVVFVFLLPAVGLSFIVGPPRDIPDSASADRYYDLGVKYKQTGWIEKSRECLNRAIKQDPNGKYGLLAQRYLKTKVPRYPQSEEAIEANINAYNERDSAKAKLMFKECIAKYPNFEWPYLNLGVLYMREGNRKKAEEFLLKVLSINPDNVEALGSLAWTMHNAKDYAQQKKYVDQALALDPDDTMARLMKNIPNK